MIGWEGSGGKAGFTTCYNKNGGRASCARSDSRVVGRGGHVEGVLSEEKRLVQRFCVIGRLCAWGGQ